MDFLNQFGNATSGQILFPGAVGSLELLGSFWGSEEASPLSSCSAVDLGSVITEPFSCTCSEDRVIEHYKKLNGQTRGQAIVK